MIRSSVITGNIVDYAATYQVKAGPGHSGTAAALTCNRFRFNAAAEACREPARVAAGGGPARVRRRSAPEASSRPEPTGPLRPS